MIFLDHGAALFDHVDYIIARLTTIAISVGAFVGIVMGIRAKIQGVHADQAVEAVERVPHEKDDESSADKKNEAMHFMSTAHPLLRASPARADKLIESAHKRMKARAKVPPE